MLFLSTIRQIVELYTNNFMADFLFCNWPIIGHYITYYNALQFEKSSIKKQKISHIFLSSILILFAVFWNI